MKTRIKRNRYLALKERDGLTCGICKESIEKEWKEYEEWLNWKKMPCPKPKQPHKRAHAGLTIDHIYPRSLARKDGWRHGELQELTNLQLAHKTCNEKKGNTEDTKGMGVLSRLWKALRLYKLPHIKA